VAPELGENHEFCASTIIASLAAATGLVVGLASPAAAATVTFGGLQDGSWGNVTGTVPDDSDDGVADIDGRAGLFDLLIDGDTAATGYCIDILTPIVTGTLDEIDWDTSGVANLDVVETILANYHTAGDGPAGYALTGTPSDKAVATQAAIWHFSDGFELEGATATEDGGPLDGATVLANYQTILDAVAADALEGFGEPTVSLSITPPASTEGVAGELVGPYVVNTTAASATLTPSEGVTLRQADGSAFTDAVVDGTEVWLKSDAEGSGTITATAAAEVGAGRVFYGENARGQALQRLILATAVTTDATAEAGVTFTAKPPRSTTSSTSTTSTSTTSTTVPVSVETTVVTEAPTTSVPVVPASQTSGGLPVTGAQTLVLVGIALALVVTGAGLGIVSRRRRLGS
jgi:TQXA domain-containing protein